jgi:hypothetical protein
MGSSVNTVTAVRSITARRPVRVVVRTKKTNRAGIAPVAPTLTAQEAVFSGEVSLVDHVKASPHLQAMVGAPLMGREKHQPKDLLRMVARFLLDSGRGYPQAEVLEVLLCFTGCSPGAAMEALQVMVAHGIVTAVNEVIRVTW